MTTPAIFAGTMGSSSDVDIGDNIANSMMLDSSLNQWLSKTLVAPTLVHTWTYSLWVKRGKLGLTLPLIGAGTGAGEFTYLRFTTGDTLDFQFFASTVIQQQRITSNVFRDPTAWLHIVLQATNSTPKIFINGVECSYSTSVIGAGNSYINTVTPHALGSFQQVGPSYFDGYFAQTVFVDGQALTPSSFGRVSPDTGQWVPKNYTGTYGTNGFKLDFTNGSALGTDSSGNGNNWTVNGGITSVNQYTDTPTNNYAVLNPLTTGQSPGVLSKGNLTNVTPTSSSAGGERYSSMQIPATGKWQIQAQASSLAAGGMLGFSPINTTSLLYFTASPSVAYYSANGHKYVNGVDAGVYGANYTTSDVIDVVVDSDAGTVTFYKNNVSQGAITYQAAGQFFVCGDGGTANSTTWNVSFGARSFTYPQANAKALCTANSPEGTAAAPATFIGNASVNGTYVHMNGAPETVTINGNAVIWGTHADLAAGGMKLRTAAAGYNAAGSNTLSATFLTPNRKSVQKYQTAKGNP